MRIYGSRFLYFLGLGFGLGLGLGLGSGCYSTVAKKKGHDIW